MNYNRPDVAAILARNKILLDVKDNGVSKLTTQEFFLAFLDWPKEHIDYFANFHSLVLIATYRGNIEIRSFSRQSDNLNPNIT